MVCSGRIAVYVGQGPERTALYAGWDDDEQIGRIIHELNFGKYSGGKAA